MDEMDIGEEREIENIYVGKNKLLIPRLILCKLTDAQTAQRLRRRHKQEIKKGVRYSSHTKNLSRLNMFISNIPYHSIQKETKYNLLFTPLANRNIVQNLEVTLQNPSGQENETRTF